MNTTTNTILNTSDAIIVREWDSDLFHQRVGELEAAGYTARRESYRILADMDPETGGVIHLYAIEMNRVEMEE